MTSARDAYYLPQPSYWPLVGSVALFLVCLGASMSLNEWGSGGLFMTLGAATLVYMLFGWFGAVIRESMGGLYNPRVDLSFRWGMAWFIFSEVMFFAAFFGALFYARIYALPWLSGEGTGIFTHDLLWPDFQGRWPPLELPDATNFQEPAAKVGAFWVPAINTAILLSSGLTVTFAHWALKKGNNRGLCFWLFATVALGILFVFLQGLEYMHAFQDLDLSLNSGIYGTLFYMLTGFHGLHVTLGATMLLVIWFRALKNHFSPQHHFAFEAVAWYWHFVDVVWLFLFVCVYLL